MEGFAAPGSPDFSPFISQAVETSNAIVHAFIAALDAPQPMQLHLVQQHGLMCTTAAPLLLIHIASVRLFDHIIEEHSTIPNVRRLIQGFHRASREVGDQLDVLAGYLDAVLKEYDAGVIIPLEEAGDTTMVQLLERAKVRADKSGDASTSSYSVSPKHLTA